MIIVMHIRVNSVLENDSWSIFFFKFAIATRPVFNGQIFFLKD